MLVFKYLRGHCVGKVSWGSNLWVEKDPGKQISTQHQKEIAYKQSYQKWNGLKIILQNMDNKLQGQRRGGSSIRRENRVDNLKDSPPKSATEPHPHPFLYFSFETGFH